MLATGQATRNFDWSMECLMSLTNQDLPDNAWSDDANIFDNAAATLLTPLLRHRPSDEYIDSSLELGV